GDGSESRTSERVAHQPRQSEQNRGASGMESEACDARRRAAHDRARDERRLRLEVRACTRRGDMLAIWGRKNSINVQKVLWCCEEMSLPYERIDAGGAYGVVDTA